MTLAQEIKEFFAGDVDDAPATLDKYSRDASLFCVVPSLVVFPKHAKDIEQLIAFVNRKRSEGRRLSLTARSAGTDMTGGPLTESIVVEMMKYMHHLISIGEDEATVEPGMFYRDFEQETMRHDLLLPSYPASREICTVGGMVANNSGGEKTLRYGKTEKYVKELKIVLADGNEYTMRKLSAAELKKKIEQNNFEGELYKRLAALTSENRAALAAAKPAVTKNSSGYFLWNVYDPADGTFDPTRLITGSQGTFGIITQITFKLIKPAPTSRLLVIFLKNLTELAPLIQETLKYQPESFELYDDNTFKLAMKFFPEILERIKGGILRAGLSFMPELWMIIGGGVPKLVLLAEFTGRDADEAKDKAEQARAGIGKIFHGKMRVTRNDMETQEFQVIRRESFNLLRHHIRGMRTAPFIDDFAVAPERLTELLAKLYKIMAKYKLLYTIAGHAGDGNLHIIPLMDLRKPGGKEIIFNLSREVYELVLSLHGTITAEHNDGIVRSPYLKEEFGEKIYELFVKTKAIFDPADIFNPGKKTGATLTFAKDHIESN